MRQVISDKGFVFPLTLMVILLVTIIGSSLFFYGFYKDKEVTNEQNSIIELYKKEIRLITSAKIIPDGYFKN